MDIVAEKYCELFDFPRTDMEKVLEVIGEEDFRGFMNSHLESLIKISETMRGECVHG